MNRKLLWVSFAKLYNKVTLTSHFIRYTSFIFLTCAATLNSIRCLSLIKMPEVQTNWKKREVLLTQNGNNGLIIGVQVELFWKVWKTLTSWGFIWNNFLRSTVKLYTNLLLSSYHVNTGLYPLVLFPKRWRLSVIKNWGIEGNKTPISSKLRPGNVWPLIVLCKSTNLKWIL